MNGRVWKAPELWKLLMWGEAEPMEGGRGPRADVSGTTAWSFQRRWPLAIPKKDSVLVGYIANFAGLISSSPTTYNVPTATATALDAASDAYIASYNALIIARNNGVRSATMTDDKDSKKDSMLQIAREVYGQIQR